ncbi:MAG TPA: methionyl-tRNA formyltransferase, partial [Chloroflexota bacterium]|nr:methionyl-tRNA formyltransferase [Chloroflexota bacterium]
ARDKHWLGGDPTLPRAEAVTRVIFMGSPAFAVPSLRRLVERGVDVAAVVTQPDRPAGRGGQVQPPAVKVAALDLSLTVLQPEKLRDTSTMNTLRAIAPDAIVVVAYGKILRPAVLDLPPLGCLNVHPSLLPKLRGAAPIQAAIRDGFESTGVTVMLLNERMDAGPILSQLRAPIFSDDTAATLGERLANLGADLLVETLPRWQAGALRPTPQNEAEATYCKPLSKDDANVNWEQPAEVIARACRAQTPWPGCQTYWAGKTVRLFDLQPLPGWRGPEAPGTTLLFATAAPPRLAIATASGAVIVPVLQLAGKRPLPAVEFLRGQPGFVGSQLGVLPSPP